MNAAQCTCPHICTAIGMQRSGWSADCPCHGKTVVAVRDGEAIVGIAFQLPQQQSVGQALATLDTHYPPTSAEINALPPNLRKWIHELETEADPAGTIRRMVLLEDENAQLRAALAERDDDAERYRALFEPCGDGSFGIPTHIGLARVGEYAEPYSKEWFDREIDDALAAKEAKS